VADKTERSEKSPSGGAASFVDKLVTDPSKPPQALLLSGFTGASSEPAHTRLYFDAELSDYVEIPDAAILHTEAMAPAQSPLGGSYVWVQRDAELVHGPVSGNRRKASFLEGRLRQDLSGGAQPIPPDTAPIVCANPTEIPRCHPTTPAMGCHPTTPAMGCHPTTPAMGCHPTTASAGCQTIPGVNCPQPTSAAAGCHTIPGVNCPNPSAVCPTHLQCPPTEVSPHCPTNIIPCQTRPVQGCGETSAHFPCFAAPTPTHLTPCPVTLPGCPTHPQLCPPPTAHATACPIISVCAVCPPTHTTPACGQSHLVLCPPPTLQACPTHVPPCGQSHLVLCPPPTLQACPTHVPPCGQSHLVVCPPPTLQACPTHAPALCPTHAPALCPTLTPVLCQPFTGTPGCGGVSIAGCPSVACNPQTIPGNPGFPGMMGGFPG
jgi:hypothetical protein